jgi:hypothetical protein
MVTAKWQIIGTLITFSYARWADIALPLLVIKILAAFCTLNLVKHVVRPRVTVIVAHYPLPLP